MGNARGSELLFVEALGTAVAEAVAVMMFATPGSAYGSAPSLTGHFVT